MALGKKTGGRRLGSPNKLGRDVRQAILQVADDLGGQERLLAWVKEAPENEKIFWANIYPKLLPRDMNIGVTKIGLEELIMSGNDPG